MSIQFDIAKQIIAETYDDNQDNFLTTCSCLSARRAYKIRRKTTESSYKCTISGGSA